MEEEQEKYIRKEIARIREFLSLIINLLNNERILIDNKGVKVTDVTK